MNETDARAIIFKSIEWGSGTDYALVDLQMSKSNNNMYYFTAFYEEHATGMKDSVPLGVNAITGEIINCTVDED